MPNAKFEVKQPPSHEYQFKGSFGSTFLLLTSLLFFVLLQYVVSDIES